LMGQKKFSEGFKLLFGIVPSQFILKEKIKTCKSLLVKEEILTNEDIANIMEFSTGSHFATTFKRFEGCTPQEFRRKMLNRVS
ncbi:MAG TPA: helix-turn-helix domain-containing protein, partial [Arachidicoccus sp.]|nr:helix-turn-helix domain-containing protein [Arachidicoccus sp.]